jgi:hypothetical protein
LNYQLDPLPRAVRRFQKSRAAITARISIRTAAQPTEDAIACGMGINLKEYRKLAIIARASEPLSLDAPRRDGRVRENYAPTGVDFDLRSCALEGAIRKLPQVQRIVIMAVRLPGKARAKEASHRERNGRSITRRSKWTEFRLATRRKLRSRGSRRCPGNLKESLGRPFSLLGVT